MWALPGMKYFIILAVLVLACGYAIGAVVEYTMSRVSHVYEQYERRPELQ